MKMKAVHCWILLWAVLWSRGDAFNLEVHSYAQHWGPPGSMFGFSVAEHMTSRENMVLVGAPNAVTSQPRVSHGGAVFRCNPLSNDHCEDLLFDNNSRDDYRRDDKSGQWFGATLTTTGLRNGPVVACAPRYVSLGERLNLRDPVGTCYIARNDFSEFTEYSPCRTTKSGHFRQGSCEAGFSAAISQNGERLFVGAPGSWYWQGQMYSINTTLRAPFMPGEYMDYGRIVEGQIYSSNTKVEPLVRSTSESDAVNDDSYLGYSAVVGDFNDMGDQGVAVGMPRGAKLYGKVVLFTWDLINYQNITGEQLGAYFGYCLAACDVDGDGLEDLIVGAPMYTIPNNEGHYENGRVYVIYQGRAESKYDIIHSLDGENSKSRFGLSLTSLGDINLDGFGDFAVGAPYDVGGGAVYIYHGSETGVRAKSVQVIRAAQLSDAATPIRTFGFSLSGGVDLDNNRYTDLAVGAYASDTTFFFRSRPVVKVTASIELGESNSKLISLDNKTCTLSPRAGSKRVACTSFKYCFQYSGFNIDLPIEFKLQFILDSKKPRDPRLFFIKNEGRNVHNESIVLNRDQLECTSVDIYIVDEVRDKLTPLEVEMRYSLAQQSSTFGYRNPRAPLTPVLDLHSGYSRKDAINIQKNCGPDNICIPNLKLQVTPSGKKYLLGSEEGLWLDVSIHNAGEDAFEASYSLQLPAGVEYVKVERADAKLSRVPVQCSPPTADNNRTLLCNIGNPLPKGQQVKFRVILEADRRPGMAAEYGFDCRVNSTNPELKADTADNIQLQTISIWVETDLALTGTSVPPDLHYNTTQYQSTNITSESDIGPQLVHVYSARNNGPSAIEEAEVYLVIPYETLAGDSLLYLLEQPETSGNIRCENAQFINTLGVRIDRKTKSYLQSSGVATQVTKELTEEGKSQLGSGVIGSHHFAWEERQSGSHSQTGNQYQTGGYQQGGGHTQTGSRYQGGGDRRGVSRTQSEVHSQTGSQYEAGRMQQGGRNTQTGSQYQGEGIQEARHTQTGVNSQSESQSGFRQGASHTQSGGPVQSGGSISKESVSQWNSSSVGDVVHHTVFNKTVEQNENGEVHKTESSTEFYTVGREGQPGSSFSKNYDQNQNGGGRTTYESGSYIRGAGRQQGSSAAEQTRIHNAAAAQHTLSTEESVNKDLINAVSSTYMDNYNNGEYSQGYNNNYGGNRGRVQVSGSEKSVGQRQTATGAGSVAYGVNGEFRTNTLDLGVLGASGTTGDESRHTGSAYGSSESSHSRQYDAASRSASGNAYDSSGSSRTSGGSSGSSRTSGGSSYDSSSSGSYRYGGSSGSVSGGLAGSRSSEYQSGFSKEYSKSGSQASSSGNQHSYESHYGSYPMEPGQVVTEKPVVAENHFRWERDTRAVEPPVPRSRALREASDQQLMEALQCKGLKCTVIRCLTGRLLKSEEVWIAFRARVDANTLNKLAAEKAVQVSSRAVGRVSRLPYIGAPAHADVRVADAVTHVTPQQPGGAGGGVPLWVVVLAACAGAALLLLLIFALYKCGFFKRNRPTDAPERQPLNKNGYGHGDEQL